jgi:hypothetical protein
MLIKDIELSFEEDFLGMLENLFLQHIPVDPYHHWQERGIFFLSLFWQSFRRGSDVQIEAFELISLNQRRG